MRRTALSMVCSALLGCAPTPADSADACEEAAVHVAECFPDRAAEPGPCDAPTADALLGTSCEDLAAAEGKADHWLCSPFTWWLCGLEDPGPRRLASRLNRPWDLAVSGGDVFYLTHHEDGEVVRTSRDGAGRLVIASGQDRPVALGVDEEHVYWVTYGSFDGGDGRLMRARRGGGSVEELADGLPHLVELVVGPDAVYLGGDGGVWVVAKDGGGQRVLSDLEAATTNTAPYLALDGRDLFVLDSWNRARLLRVDVDTGAHEVLASELDAGPMVIVDGFVYWAHGEGIARIPTTGGATELVAAVSGGSRGLTAVPGGLALTDGTAGTVSTLDLETLDLTTVARRQAKPGPIVHDDGALFFLNEGTYFSVDYNEDGEVVRVDLR